MGGRRSNRSRSQPETRDKENEERSESRFLTGCCPARHTMPLPTSKATGASSDPRRCRSGGILCRSPYLWTAYAAYLRKPRRGFRRNLSAAVCGSGEPIRQQPCVFLLVSVLLYGLSCWGSSVQSTANRYAERVFGAKKAQKIPAKAFCETEGYLL